MISYRSLIWCHLWTSKSHRLGVIEVQSTWFECFRRWLVYLLLWNRFATKIISPFTCQLQKICIMLLCPHFFSNNCDVTILLMHTWFEDCGEMFCDMHMLVNVHDNLSGTKSQIGQCWCVIADHNYPCIFQILVMCCKSDMNMIFNFGVQSCS